MKIKREKKLSLLKFKLNLLAKLPFKLKIEKIIKKIRACFLKVSWLEALVIFFISFVFIFLIQACFQANLLEYEATPILEDRKGQFLSEGESEYACLGFWDMPDPIPKRILECVLTIEDKRFYEHMGIDFLSIARALVNNLSGNPIQGASTIAMQVARLQNPKARNIFSKINEMAVAWFLMVRHGHNKVLHQYFKIAPLGNQIYGFAYAARRYFKKPIEDLSWAEASLLAALPQSPSAMSLFSYQGFERALKRAKLVLKVLLREKRISEEEYKTALRQMEEMSFQYREARPETSYHFTLRLLRLLNKQKQISFSTSTRTTLDLNLQNTIQMICNAAMEEYRALGARNLAIIVADKKNGEILAYIGSQNYFDKFSSGAINFACTPRSSGSSVKPFLYALGLDTGIFSPGSILADLPFSILGPKGEYSVGNFDDEFLGPMLYRRALANSRNTPTLRVLEGVGMERTFDFFVRCGLADRTKGADYYGYGLPLGGLYVTLEDLVAAYGILANAGTRFRLRWLLNEKEPSPKEQIMSKYAAQEITNILADPLARLPSFPRLSALEFNFPVAVKTGTSVGYRDAWAVGYSAKYIVGVWIGDPDNAPMNKISGSFIARLFHEIMVLLHPAEARGINVEPFPMPEGAKPVEICVLSGKLKGPDCSDTVIEYFKEGTEPQTSCPVHRRYLVDKQTGELATENTIPSNIEFRPFTVLPAEYASWGSRKGFGRPPLENKAKDLEKSKIKIVYPPSGATYVLDPELPKQFQTIALRAEVFPQIPALVWLLNGKEYCKIEYPYEVRLPLEIGKHFIQASFPNAFIKSEVIEINVVPF